jgi:uncharacterized membrane protein YbhN (UPF0104 family)
MNWQELRQRLAAVAVALPLPGGLRRWVTLASAGFLLAALWGHGRQLLELQLDGQGWLWLLLGIGMSLLSLVVNGLAWGVLLRWLGHRPRWVAVVLLFLDSNLRKYLPGGIWHLAQRLRALQTATGAQPSAPVAQPFSARQAAVAVLLEPLLAAVAALALVAWGGWQGGLGLLCLLPLGMLWPRWFGPLLGRLERRRVQAWAEQGLLQAPDPDLDDAAQAPAWPARSVPWPPLLAELAFVLLRFGGFACCVQAFDLAFSLGWGGWLAGFALAWTAGLVVPGAPGGLGVFEAVLLLRLTAVVPEAPLLAVAISYRLVTATADLLAAAMARRDLAALRNRSYC